MYLSLKLFAFVELATGLIDLRTTREPRLLKDLARLRHTSVFNLICDHVDLAVLGM